MNPLPACPASSSPVRAMRPSNRSACGLGLALALALAGASAQAGTAEGYDAGRRGDYARLELELQAAEIATKDALTLFPKDTP